MGNYKERRYIYYERSKSSDHHKRGIRAIRNILLHDSFSPIEVKKDDRIVKCAEYHTTTWEGIVALDDDMIIHVAPASAGTPVPQLAKAFLVPKGSMVKINAAIWHLCPLPANNEVLHAMIILPECTYANDCTVVEFEGIL